MVVWDRVPDRNGVIKPDPRPPGGGPESAATRRAGARAAGNDLPHRVGQAHGDAAGARHVDAYVGEIEFGSAATEGVGVRVGNRCVVAPVRPTGTTGYRPQAIVITDDER